MYLWMEITTDIYQLPVAVADSEAELARMRGVSRSAVGHVIHGKGNKYIRVKVNGKWLTDLQKKEKEVKAND